MLPDPKKAFVTLRIYKPHGKVEIKCERKIEGTPDSNFKAFFLLCCVNR